MHANYYSGILLLKTPYGLVYGSNLVVVLFCCTGVMCVGTMSGHIQEAMHNVCPILLKFRNNSSS